MGITLSPWMMAFLVLMTGFAGFVDSAAGGGGLISLPAYLFAGLPPHYTYATNKFSAACGTTSAKISCFIYFPFLRDRPHKCCLLQFCPKRRCPV